MGLISPQAFFLFYFFNLYIVVIKGLKGEYVILFAFTTQQAKTCLEIVALRLYEL